MLQMDLFKPRWVSYICFYRQLAAAEQTNISSFILSFLFYFAPQGRISPFENVVGIIPVSAGKKLHVHIKVLNIRPNWQKN